MGDFTYTVFLIVLSLITALVSVFAVGAIGVLFSDTYRRIETD